LNKALHEEPRAARLGEIDVVRRGPVNGDVLQQLAKSPTEWM